MTQREKENFVFGQQRTLKSKERERKTLWCAETKLPPRAETTPAAEVIAAAPLRSHSGSHKGTGKGALQGTNQSAGTQCHRWRLSLLARIALQFSGLAGPFALRKGCLARRWAPVLQCLAGCPSSLSAPTRTWMMLVAAATMLILAWPDPIAGSSPTSHLPKRPAPGRLLTFCERQRMTALRKRSQSPREWLTRSSSELSSTNPSIGGAT